MKCFCPNLLEKWTCGYWTQYPVKPIVNFCFDTRQLKVNECFLALRSKYNDGHLYIAEAENKGAIAALVERPIKNCTLPQLVVQDTLKAFQAIAKNYRHSLKTNIIGITGSCGKTTAKELLALLLGPETFKTPGNYNNHLGLPFSITQIDNENHQYAVLEVGMSKPNEMDYLSELLHPDFSVLLNVNSVHLENFKTLEAIANEKIKLLKNTQTGVFCPEEWFSYVKHQNISVFRTEKENLLKNDTYLRPKIIPEGWEIEVNDQHFYLPFRLGEKSAWTFAQILGVALKLGMSVQLVQERLLQWKPYQQRGVWKKLGNRKVFIDCYNANPAAFIDSLQHFYRDLEIFNKANTSVCYCIGSMLELGNESIKFHRKLAHYFHINVKDYFILIGDYKEVLCDSLLALGMKASHIYSVDTIMEAKEILKQLPSKFVYLKGSHSYHLENLIAE